MSNSLTVKRQVIVKTIVTEDFKNRAENELMNEVKLINSQINHIQAQLNQIIQQFQQGTALGSSIDPREADQIINEFNAKLQQLLTLKQNLQQEISNIKTSKPGETIITGSLENYVEIKPGDNIYDKLVNKEIIVKDGIVQEIRC